MTSANHLHGLVTNYNPQRGNDVSPRGEEAQFRGYDSWAMRAGPEPSCRVKEVSNAIHLHTHVLRVRRSLGAALSGVSAPSAFPLMIATWTSAPFLSRLSSWVIHVISVAWRRNAPFVGSLLVKLHATHTLQALP